jgi:hypothetical protein
MEPDYHLRVTWLLIKSGLRVAQTVDTRSWGGDQQKASAERTTTACLAVVSVGAGALHFAVVGEHFKEYWLFGAFFVTVAWLQMLWAGFTAWRPGPTLFLAGAIGNAVVIAIWIWSRTRGLPIGPDAGQPEDAAFIDVLSTAFEGLLVASCLVLLFFPFGRRTISPLISRAVLITIAAAVVLLTSGALTSASPGPHGEQSGHLDHAAGNQSDQPNAPRQRGVRARFDLTE